MPEQTNPSAAKDYHDEDFPFWNDVEFLKRVIDRQTADKRKVDERIIGLIAKSYLAQENIDELYSRYLIASKRKAKELAAAESVKECKTAKRPSRARKMPDAQ